VLSAINEAPILVEESAFASARRKNQNDNGSRSGETGLLDFYGWLKQRDG
jgi:hypothetical protein